jgi:hypothetical protein
MEHALAFVPGQLVDARGEGAVDEKQFAAAVGMADDDRVRRLRRARAEDLVAVVDRGQSADAMWVT